PQLSERLMEPRGLGRGPERAVSEAVGGVEEAVGAPERGIAWIGPLAGCRPPQGSLELLETIRQLGRTAGRWNVGIGPQTGRIADVLVGDPRKHRQHEASVGERREIPRLGGPKRRCRPSTDPASKIL